MDSEWVVLSESSRRLTSLCLLSPPTELSNHKNNNTQLHKYTNKSGLQSTLREADLASDGPRVHPDYIYFILNPTIKLWNIPTKVAVSQAETDSMIKIKWKKIEGPVDLLINWGHWRVRVSVLFRAWRTRMDRNLLMVSVPMEQALGWARGKALPMVEPMTFM